MEIIEKRDEKTLILCLKGELDHHGATSALEKIGYSCDAALPNHVLLDFAGVTFMDSSGIALILRVHKRMQALGGRVLVMDPAVQPLRVLDASGIDRLVRVATTVKESVQ